MIDHARTFRLSVLPDERIGQIPKTSYNASLRAGWYKSHVPERASAVLDSIAPGVSPERLVEMKAIGHLVGVLDTVADTRKITPSDLEAEGFPPLVILGTRLVQGEAFDTPASHFRKLAIGFDHFKLVKGALWVAEVEDVLPLPRHDIRRRKVIGYGHNAVGQLLRGMSAIEGQKLAALLEETLPPLPG